MTGWYYLHTNGELIYKKELGGTAADIRESDFAIGLWPLDQQDREGAWNIIVEGLAAGANPVRVLELAELWKCFDEDAHHYAKSVGAKLYLDGDHWCATRLDFTDQQRCPAGFGKTCLEALADLCKKLGYKPSKMWPTTFRYLLSRPVAIKDDGLEIKAG